MSTARRIAPYALVGLLILVVSGCAAGDARFTVDAPAGFWAGLWHGMISVVTLIIGIFSDSVHVYEVDNTGGWYDFGFLMGALCIWGGGSTSYQRRARKTREEREWEEIGKKVEAKVRRKIREWAEAEPDEEWEVVEVEAREKLKRKVREWAEEP